MYQTQHEKYAGSQEYREKMKARARKYHNDHREEIKIKRKAYFAKYRADNRERLREEGRTREYTELDKIKRKKFYNDNPERDKYRTRRAYLKRMFGITLEDYEFMVKSQDDCCSICGKHRTKNGRRLAVDHCHITGKVRGLLCSHCNKALGTFKDSINILNKAIEYLQKESPLIKVDNLDYCI